MCQIMFRQVLYNNPKKRQEKNLITINGVYIEILTIIDFFVFTVLRFCVCVGSLNFVWRFYLHLFGVLFEQVEDSCQVVFLLVIR